MSPERRRKSGPGVDTILQVFAVAICAAIYFLRLDRAVGLFVDDAWYLVLAKSLATGHGFELINSASPGILPAYPPMFPALLSLFFRVYPAFPNNIWLLKLVSIASVFAAALIAYRYFIKIRAVDPSFAFWLTLLVLLTPGLVFLATSTLMSECLFTLLFLSSIFCIESYLSAPGERHQQLVYLLVGTLLACAAFLTRSIAIGLIVALLAALLSRRKFRDAILASALVAAVAGGWSLYSFNHRPTPAQQAEQGGYIVASYADQFWQTQAGVEISERISVWGLPGRVLDNAWEIVRRDMGVILAAPLYRTADNSGLETSGVEGIGQSAGAVILSLGLSLVTLLGLVSCLRSRITFSELAFIFTLGAILLWPWKPLRFLLPLVPLLFYYFYAGVMALLSYLEARYPAMAASKAMLARLSLEILLALAVLDHCGYLYQKFYARRPPLWIVYHQETLETVNWIKANIPAEEILAADNPGLVFMYAGNQTNFAPNPFSQRQLLLDRGAKYFVHTRPDASIGGSPRDPHPVLFETPLLRFYVKKLE